MFLPSYSLQPREASLLSVELILPDIVESAWVESLKNGRDVEENLGDQLG